MLFNEPFGGIIPGARGAVLAALLRTEAPLTGRGVYGLLSDEYSLWTVQEALKVLARLGIVSIQTIGRAGVYTINEAHVAIPHLRALLDPITSLTEVVRETVGDEVKAVILFGSVARGEAGAASDIDLAVAAPANWAGRTELADAVSARLGNRCDVVVFSPAQFTRLARTGEPVVARILADGVPLVGSMPHVRRGAA